MLNLPEKAFLRVDEIAEFYDVSHRTVREWIRVGKLKAVRVARTVRIARVDVLEMAEAINGNTLPD
jgi:excisionase family DNA binding protein